MTRDQDSDDEIFANAIELADAVEREAYLSSAVPGDPERRQRIERLVDCHLKAGKFLDAPAGIELTGTACFTPDEPLIAEQPGDRIGRYKLLQQIGEGGCGVVYVAEQTEPIHRRVALKVIKRGMDTRAVVARFEAERQALAMMDHPNIAKVLDAGATATGRPFFVMELVRGIKITDYCDQNNLPVQERLKLFVQVCLAVAHAHQKGIIHRDIKPSNVLVTLHDGVPVPKVIDFGIAKATSNQMLTDKTVYTAFEQFIGTPAYMSPEQAEMSGLDIDTRSDVYSLGVLLYELLTGRTPFESSALLQAGLDRMRQIIRQQEPARPSVCLRTLAAGDLTAVAERHRLEPPRLISLVRGDLDWIVMKALEKDRTRRYETVNGMAADVERHLRAEPVIAAAPSVRYRVAKFVRRNRVPLAIASAFAVVLVGATVVSTWLAVTAEHAKREAVEQRKAADILRVVAEKGEAESRGLHYFATMNLARQAWDTNDVQRVRQLLRDTANYTDRGFEWYYWQRQCRLAEKTIYAGASVRALAVSPDGRWIASGHNGDRNLRDDTGAYKWGEASVSVWDAATGRLVYTLGNFPPRGHDNVENNTHASFSPDSRRIVVAANREAIAKVYDLQTGGEIYQLTGHTDAINATTFSPDGKQILTGSRDATARIWDSATGKEIRKLDVPNARVWGAGFSPDGKYVATGHEQGFVVVWDVESGTERFRFQATSDKRAVEKLEYSSDGKRIVTAGRDNVASIWDADTGQKLADYTGHSGVASTVAFSPDGKFVASAGEDNTVYIWDAATGRPVNRLKGHFAGVTELAYLADGRLVTGAYDSMICIWNVDERPDGAVVFRGHKGDVRSLTFSPEGRRIASAGEDATVRLWSAESGEQIASFTGHSGPVRSVVFGPDENSIVTSGDDGTVRVWQMGVPDSQIMYQGKQAIAAAVYSPDAKRLAIAEGNRVNILGVASRKEQLSFMALEEEVEGIAFSSDGKRLVTYGTDKEGLHQNLAINNMFAVAVWDASTGQRLFHVNQLSEGQDGWLAKHKVSTFNIDGAAALSPDGNAVAIGDRVDRPTLWRVSDGVGLKELIRGHRGDVYRLAFTADGRRLVTAGTDGTVRVWDVSSGRDVLTLPAPEALKYDPIAISQDGRRIAAACYDGSIAVWTAATREDVSSWQAQDKQLPYED